MKEPDGESLASDTGPKSCEGGSNDALEALTGVRAGWVLSLERWLVRGADEFPNFGRQHGPARQRKDWTDPAIFEDPMHARTHLTGRRSPSSPKDNPLR